MSETAESTVLQHVDLDADPATESLYFSYDWKERRRHAILDPDGALRVPGGLRVTFNTYFNSFFENYWFRYTAVHNATLRVEVEGRGVISAYRQAAEGPVYLVRRVEYDTPEPQTIEIGITRDTGFTYSPGRVWFDVEADGDSRVLSGTWETTDVGRNVATSVVICAFNREEYLAKILEAIRTSPEVSYRLAKILIVNQGNSFAVEDLIPNAPKQLINRIEIIEQENLGGCGGFTRGLYETLRDDSLTHFILLDDDIKLHPESLFRAIQFMSYANDDVAVGGHMLDLVQPNSLYEAGAQLDPAVAEPVPVNHALQLANPKNLEEFLTIRPIDYNGWWMFGGSKKMIEEVGLPMPSFIRGDDIEYGVRLARHGYQTVPVPGIAVWHEPFYFKLGNWHLYFEVRNRLTMLSLHGNGSLNAVARKLRRVFTRDAMFARYHSCQFIIAALEDYLAGPEKCFVTTNDALLERLEEFKQLGPQRIADAGESNVRSFAGPVKLVTKPVFPLLRAARLIAPPRPAGPRIPTMTPKQLAPWRLAVFNTYRLIEPADGSVWEYTRNVELERTQLRRFESLLRQLRFTFGEEAVDRSKDVPWLGVWQKLFGAAETLPPETVTEDATAEAAGAAEGS